jgi:hypothetical protein
LGRPKLFYSHFLKDSLKLNLNPAFVENWKEEAWNEVSWKIFYPKPIYQFGA